jgi:hypothetical protein
MPDGPAEVPAVEDAPFSAVREQAEAMIAWARSAEALGMGHGQVEEHVGSDGMELARLLAQGHMDLRAAR